MIRLFLLESKGSVHFSLFGRRKERKNQREKRRKGGLRPDAPLDPPPKIESTAIFTQLKSKGIASISAEARIINSRAAAF